VQQKSGFKNLLLEKKLAAILEQLEKKETQLNEVLAVGDAFARCGHGRVPL
jgi:hypothetical protein